MSSDASVLPEWISAIATAMTFLGGGLAAYLSFRRTRKQQLPIVEATTYMATEREQTLVGMNFTIRNRLPERVRLDKIVIVAPRSLRHALPVWSEHRDEIISYSKAADLVRPYSQTIAPVGHQRSAVSSGDTIYEHPRFFMDEKSSPKQLIVDLYFSSLADSFSGKRLRMRRTFPKPDSGSS